MDQFDRIRDADLDEYQSPNESNQGAWGRTLTLNPDGSSTAALDARHRGAAVVHAIQEASDAPHFALLVVQQGRSASTWEQSLIVPPWGIAIEVPGGYTRALLRSAVPFGSPPLTGPTKWTVGITGGPALRSWVQAPSQFGEQSLGAGVSKSFDPPPWARRVTVTCTDGSLDNAAGNQILATGQSYTAAADTVHLKGHVGTGGRFYITWEVVT